MENGLRLTKKSGGLLTIKYIEVINVFNQYKYTDKEIEHLIKSMVILIDTREKKMDHNILIKQTFHIKRNRCLMGIIVFLYHKMKIYQFREI